MHRNAATWRWTMPANCAPAMPRRWSAPSAPARVAASTIAWPSLEPPRSELIRTAFFDGITYEELAARTDTPIGTVKSWIRRGLAKLKACLER